ncbi:hypothetical protein QZH41_020116, partial [Actinostola sp. cb2023]
LAHKTYGNEGLNGFDRLYLSLAEKEIPGLFNELCFEHKVNSLDDLKQHIKKNKGRLHHKDRLTELTVKNCDFDKLAKKHGIFNHEANLANLGVPIIPIANVDIQKRIGTGPLSGVACSAILTEKNGEKVRVCLRYPRNEQQLFGFINEAKTLSAFSHPNILKLHGVIALGPYVDSIALVMEFAPNGNIVESLCLLTVKSFCSILPQILNVLQYVDNNGFVHCRLSEFAVFIMSPTMIKIGGFGGCVPRDSLPKTNILKFFRYCTVNSIVKIWSLFGNGNHQKAPMSRNHMNWKDDEAKPLKCLLNPSVKGRDEMISWFAFFVERIFFLLERSRPREVTFTKTKAQVQTRFDHFCPEVLFPLLKQCYHKPVPSYEKLFDVLLSNDFPPMVQMNTSFKAEHPGDISINKDEIVLVISKSLISIHHKPLDNFWLGEKEDGQIGLFNGNLATPISNTEALSDSDDNGEKDHEGTQITYISSKSVPVEIKARGSKAEHAYRRALKHGKVVVYRGRIMLVGQERAGKTSLKNSLLGLPFNPQEQSTVGVDVDPSCCCIDVDHVKNWQRTDRTHVVSDFADNIARMIADDLKQVEQRDEVKDKKQDDFKQDEKSISQVQQQVKEESDNDGNIEDEEGEHEAETPSFSETQEGSQDNSGESSMATEPDVVPEDVTERVILYLQGLNLDDSSTKPQTTVSIWDFAGQHLYYASHPVFLSPRAVYLLVYNLSKDLNVEAEPCVRQGTFDILLENADKQTNLEAILSWMVSIHSSSDQEEVETDLKKLPGDRPYLRPPIIMVGTNADRPFQDPKKMEVFIKKNLSGKSYQQHLVKPFYTVNNTVSSADEGIQRLQEKIIEVFGMEPYMGEHIPVRWLNFEKAIQALVEKKTYYLLFADLEKIVHEICFIEERDEIRALLFFYHDLGVIIKHGDTVVLQAQWLIDLFRKLITVRPYDDQNPMYEECWNDLEESGILRMELVEHVFSELLDSGQSKEDLLGMMEHYGLIAGFRKVAGSGDVRYFVPAQLQSSPEELLDIQPSPTGPCALYVHFVDGFVPHGLYSLVVSKCIAWCSKDGSPHEPNLYRNVSRFIIGKSSDYELILICCKRFIKVILNSLQANTCIYQPAVPIRRFIESTLQGISDECTWYRSLRYQLTVLCPSCSQSSKPCVKHRAVACTHDDCIHLLAITEHQVMVCTKSFGKESRPDIQNLEAWYSTPKVIISCVTDRYCKSENCQREATLADTIKKPIIPLLLEPIPWPPAGQLGPIFAKLLYIDMTQGYQTKMEELVKKIKSYMAK